MQSDSIKLTRYGWKVFYKTCDRIILEQYNNILYREAEKGSTPHESIVADLLNKALSVAELILHVSLLLLYNDK